jgi:hypothetical protein
VTAPESPAALLLRAAAHLDELAANATKGPWADHDPNSRWGANYDHLLVGGGKIIGTLNTEHNGPLNAAYIAAVDPLAGRDFAAMLRAAAEDAAACDRQNARHSDIDGKTRVMYHPMTVAAISAARNVLKEAS